MDDDELQDPDVIAALRRIGARADDPVLCPSCARRYVPSDQDDVCGPCADEQRRTSKREWWRRQGDYGALLADGHRPVEAARRWLAHRLRKGPVASADMVAEATRAGIAERTLHRARHHLEQEGRLAIEQHGRRTTWRLTTRAERQRLPTGSDRGAV